jgi:hypothetical protein
MKKVLAITVALMIAAIVLMPALGYTNQAAGNQSYTAKSGDKVDYSFTTKVPAHNLTPDIMANKYSFKSAAVQSNRMPYSFQQGAATPYSIKLVGVEKAAMLDMEARPVTKLGSMNKMEDDELVVPPVAEPKFSIEGMVVDNNQNVLAGWTVNLTKDGAFVNSVPTASDGKFAFADLAAGEYTISPIYLQGWSTISPADGKFVVVITDASVTDLVFVNQLEQVTPTVSEPAVAENVTPPLENATEAINVTV